MDSTIHNYTLATADRKVASCCTWKCDRTAKRRTSHSFAADVAAIAAVGIEEAVAVDAAAVVVVVAVLASAVVDLVVVAGAVAVAVDVAVDVAVALPAPPAPLVA